MIAYIPDSRMQYTLLGSTILDTLVLVGGAGRKNALVTTPITSEIVFNDVWTIQTADDCNGSKRFNQPACSGNGVHCPSSSHLRFSIHFSDLPIRHMRLQ